jgi:hypothetical protein
MTKRSTAIVLLFAVATACGDDDETVSTPKPPPELAITEVRSAGGPVWTPGSGESCVEAGSDPSGSLLVSIAPKNFTLRPPGACGSLRPCGTAVLMLDGTQAAESGSNVLSVAFGGPDAGLAFGEHTFRAELRDHLGDVVLDAEQQVVSNEVVLEVRAPGGCTGATDAGSDAPADGAADAGNDAAEDAASDASADAAADAGTDGTSPDSGTDAASDAPND